MEKEKLIQALTNMPQRRYNPNCDLYKDKFYLGFRLRLGEREGNLFIFEDGRCLENPNIPFTSSLLCEENQISNDGIKRFLENEKIEPQRIYEESVKLEKEFLDIENTVYDLLFFWNLHTFGINLFGVTPYVHIKGLAGSGKSTIMKFCSLLTPKSEYIINPSLSTLFRGIDISQNTIFFDEFENYDEKYKREVISILNAGYTKGGNVPRAVPDKNNDWKKVKFKVFSPKMFASVGELEKSTLRSRTIEVYTLQTNEKIKDIINLNKIDEGRFIRLRDDYYIFWLQNWKEIKEIYDNLEDIQIYGRNLQIIKPILALAKFFGKYEEILAFFKTEIEERRDELVETDRNFILLNTLFYMVRGHKIRRLSVSEIVDRYNAELGDLKGDKDKWKATNKSLGKQLKRLNLNQNRVRLADGMHYDFDINVIVERLRRYGYDKYLDQDAVVSAVSEVSVDKGIVEEEQVKNE